MKDPAAHTTSTVQYLVTVAELLKVICVSTGVINVRLITGESYWDKKILLLIKYIF